MSGFPIGIPKHHDKLLAADAAAGSQRRKVCWSVRKCRMPRAIDLMPFVKACAFGARGVGPALW